MPVSFTTDTICHASAAAGRNPVRAKTPPAAARPSTLRRGMTLKRISVLLMDWEVAPADLADRLGAGEK
jgi:hypothetical protein